MLEYATDEQRRKAGCIAARMQAEDFHHRLCGHGAPASVNLSPRRRTNESFEDLE